MPEIVFDSFQPNTDCLEPPPQNPQKKDLCRIEASFHLRDEEKAVFSLPLQRERDQFLLDTSERGHEVALGLMRSSGLSLHDPKFQSTLAALSPNGAKRVMEVAEALVPVRVN